MADNEFGYTPWGMDWVRLAEPLRQNRPDPLLPRARSIARNNGVRADIEGRIVRAHIHRGGQASVTHIEFAPLSRDALTALAGILPPKPIVLTDDMHRAAVAAGAHPTPVPAATDCSCSARTPRCVHVLATFYEMARRVDENPRISLEVQGYGVAPAEVAAAAATPGEVSHRLPVNTLDPAGFFDLPPR
ncbi:SWIM zinc finger-containing protein [Nocardia brevicatena]|uniref:SWIM zinc finger-containing protein n=1 Tax=Nocardia brevicatena TaxID=37327 RepID=UPI0002ECF860|nr:SWIM zinc finger-containing protein [Nocardia brevicatena]